jgi:hypothetical protein
MSDQSFDLGLGSAELSEQYYQCFDRWNLKRNSDHLRAACVDLAERYRQAVVDHMAYLNSMSPSRERDEALMRDQEHLDLLLRDMNLMLQERHGSFGGVNIV